MKPFLPLLKSQIKQRLAQPPLLTPEDVEERERLRAALRVLEDAEQEK